MENTTHLLSGIPLRNHLFAQIQKHVEMLNIKPRLAVVRIEGDAASKIYVNMKKRTAIKLGMVCDVTVLPPETDQDTLNNLLQQLSTDASVHGILLQLPLPAHLDTHDALEHIAPEKDVDGLTPINTGRLVVGAPHLQPATPLGVMRLLEHANIKTAGLNTVVIGSSNLVGGPLARMLTLSGATVTVCNSKTKDISTYTKQADLIVTAVGKPGLLGADMVKDGCVLVDVGINKIADLNTKKGYRLVGDMDFTTLQEKAKLITPVPGGVGPMTVATLMTNLVDAALTQTNQTPINWQL
jgi:methylenetetrahydrofolate dehydrogenase (NADP+)/methenyltetrahydrofolate cyclohydrolase